MLRHVPVVDDPRVLADAATRDDAAVFKMTEDRAVVATVDFFAPVVDDPFDFGAIAAANALSDLYAMGATPLFALNLIAWPRDPEMLTLLEEAVRGEMAKVQEAGAFLLGGHSIDDPEPKLGLVAIGEVHPDRIRSNRGARPGDALVLTKPLGTGILSTALKRDLLESSTVTTAVDVMSTLNAGAARAVAALGDDVHAVTDVTGFGLLGHVKNVMEASNVSASIRSADLPVLPRVLDLIERDAVPGGTQRNLDAASEFTGFGDVPTAYRLLAADAQTSGGLLIAVDAAATDRLLAALQAEAAPVAAVIGEVHARGGQLITLS